MLETIGAAMLEWIIGEGMDKTREVLRREPQVRDLDEVIRKAVGPAVEVATSDSGLNGDLVMDAVATAIVRGIADNARRGGSLEPLANEQQPRLR